MKTGSIVFVMALVYGSTGLAQESDKYVGPADCKLAAIASEPGVQVFWDGPCQDGYAHGKGVLERDGDKSKKYRLEATLVRGVIAGEATMTMADGSKYTGTFTKGVPNGTGYFSYADGMQYEGEVRNGEPEGNGEGIFSSGNHYWGQWRNGKPDGTGRMQYMLGGQYDGEWKSGKRHGRGTLTYAGSGRTYTGQFVDGKMAGAGEAPAPTEKYVLKSNQAPTGTHLKNDAARTTGLPLNIGYQDFTPEQKSMFNSFYPALEEGDEPPYPLYGPQEFYRLMSKVTGNYWVRGKLKIFVQVGADGRAESVTMLGLKDDEVRRIANSGAGSLRYKPALCRGKPCPMMFLFNLDLQPEL